MLPQVFEMPFDLRDELLSTKSKIEILVMRSSRVMSISESFLIAYRVEFYMLHPEFEALFILSRLSSMNIRRAMIMTLI